MKPDQISATTRNDDRPFVGLLVIAIVIFGANVITAHLQQADASAARVLIVDPES